jgi:Tripartite tricarboxylate transporter family receptor
MKLERRKFLNLAAGAVALPVFSRVGRAQTYPTRPITMIVPLAAGGGIDVTGRVLADRMRRSLGQPVIVENVTGGDGNIATARAAQARPDGYTIEIGFISTHALNGAFYSLSYDVVNDFAPISLLTTTPQVLFARKGLPANDLNELIAWLKANPNKASAGITSVGARLQTTFFRKGTGTQITLVPYRGAAPNPILKAAAAEAVKKKGELEDSGMTAPTPRNQCWPEGVPFIFDNMGIQILRQPDKITILYEHDHQVRQIRLNQVHPAQVSPSWYGDSVGHYEADTLVIDTVGFKIGPFSMVDWYGVPYTEALHVTERYRLVDDDEAVKNAEERGTITNNRLSRRASAATGIAVDRNYKGKVLQLQFTVEDQGVFTMPWSASVIYRRSADEWPEHVCAENPRRSPATPTAAEADF